MLSLFPQLLFLSPLSATLLRIASACIFLYLAYFYFNKRRELGHIEFLFVGRGTWIPVVVAFFAALPAIGLLVGIYTQLAAILGALLALKSIVWKRRYPAMFPFSRVTMALLFVICVSLIFTGAGAFAFDWPL